ncbi:MAG TPA: FecR family protein [Bryobacteraceae bacterium]|nr:FecR family protein [Bryobacteraceae bacterium]
MKYKFGLLIFALTLVPALFGQARVVSATGIVSLTRAGRSMGALQVQAAVEPGDEIATGENSEALVQAPDGSTVRIYPDSRVVIQEYTANLRDWLHLFLGSVKVHIQRISGRPNPRGMTTPTAIIAVRGTTFDVFVDDMDATLVQVDEGLVSVVSRAAPGQEVLVRPGQRTWVRQGAAPTEAASAKGVGQGRGQGQGQAQANEKAKQTLVKALKAGSKPGRGVDAPPGRGLGVPGRAPGKKPSQARPVQ